MADKNESLEKGEYVIGIAIILAALLVSATVYISTGNIEKALTNLKLTAPSAQQPAAQQPAAQQPAAQQPAAPQGAIKLSGLDYSDAYYTGKEDGKVIFVEYSDFQCPYCEKVVPAVEQVKTDYTDMKRIFRHFPLGFHPDAQKAAEATECAGVQGKFWEMHGNLFASQNALAVSDLKGYALALGLNVTAFNTCLDSGEMAGVVSAQQSEGSSIGVQGTPSFLVYSKSDKSAALETKLQAQTSILTQLGVDAAVVEIDGAGTGIVFSGALPYQYFKGIMDSFN